MKPQEKIKFTLAFIAMGWMMLLFSHDYRKKIQRAA